MAIPFVSRLGQEEATSATITNAIEDGETHHAVNWRVLTRRLVPTAPVSVTAFLTTPAAPSTDTVAQGDAIQIGVEQHARSDFQSCLLRRLFRMVRALYSTSPGDHGTKTQILETQLLLTPTP